MSQDTRKDKRAKVVSLNVRYKSATVDEFIENHSHDVSKGGLFVKTPTPFPPGTLLKFEIRLAGDKSVISGVGRVVWKREPTQAGADKPAGMGVKFIKIDDSSRAIIDRLIAQKADAGSAYMSEDPVEEGAAAGHPSTLKGLVAAAPVSPAPAPGRSPVTAPAAPAGGAKIPVPSPTAAAPAPKPAPAPAVAAKVPAAAPPAPASEPKLAGARPAASPANKLASTVLGVAPPGAAKAVPAPAPVPVAAAPTDKPSEPKPAPRPPPARKATMMGMAPVVNPAVVPPAAAATPSPPEAPAPSPPSATATAEPMFPRLDAESGSEPVRDQTVMKQAAELLEEALKEAGGSLEEIGQNPLFSSERGSAIHEQAPTSARAQSGATMIMSSPSPGDQPSPVSSPPAAAGLGGLSPSAPAVSEARTTGASFKEPPVGEAKRAAEAEKRKGGSAGLLVAALLLLVLAGGGYYAYATGMLAGIVGPSPAVPRATPRASASASNASPATPPSASGAAMAAGDSGPSATDASAAGTATDASAAAAVNATAEADSGTKDAGKVGTTTTAAPPPPAPVPPRPAPPPRPKPPAPPPTPTGETPSGETPAPAPVPVPTPAPAPTPKSDPANEL